MSADSVERLKSTVCVAHAFYLDNSEWCLLGVYRDEQSAQAAIGRQMLKDEGRGRNFSTHVIELDVDYDFCPSEAP